MNQIRSTLLSVVILSLALVAVTCGVERPPQAPPIDPAFSQARASIDATSLAIDQLDAAIRDLDAKIAALQDASTPSATPVSIPAPKPAPVAVAAVDVRPGHWNITGDWNASKAKVIAHLRNEHPSKAAQHEPLESKSLETLLTYHDDAHEGRTTAVATVRSAAPVRSAPVSSCPGGVCPTNRSSVSYGRGLFGWRR